MRILAHWGGAQWRAGRRRRRVRFRGSRGRGERQRYAARAHGSGSARRAVAGACCRGPRRRRAGAVGRSAGVRGGVASHGRRGRRGHRTAAAEWPGRVRIVRTRAEVVAPGAVTLVSTDVDDPLMPAVAAATALVGARNGVRVARVLREAPNGADSAAARGGAAVVYSPRAAT